MFIHSFKFVTKKKNWWVCYTKIFYLLCCGSFVELFGFRMIYTAIDNFYLTDEQLKNSPSRKDGIDEATETTLRIYGCDLIQKSGILLKLYPVFLISLYVGFMKLFTFLNFVGSYVTLIFVLNRPQVVATGQVLFHRFYCKKSFARFNVKVKFCLLWFSLYIENKCRKGKGFFEMYPWCSSC